MKKARNTRRPALEASWEKARSAYAKAEKELTKQVRHLLKRNKMSAPDASALLKELRARVGRERKRALRDVEARMAGVQARMANEGKMLTRMVKDAVQTALAAFNIPSRREVVDLTRKVEELSARIDGFRRRPRPRTRRSAA